MTEDLCDRLHTKLSQDQNQRTLMVRQKVSVFASGSWFSGAVGEYFRTRETWFKPHENMISKREAQDSLSEKKKNKGSEWNWFPSAIWGVDFPPQILGNVNTYRVTYKTTNVIFWAEGKATEGGLPLLKKYGAYLCQVLTKDETFSPVRLFSFL